MILFKTHHWKKIYFQGKKITIELNECYFLFLSSPRSLYACKRQGVLPNELQPKTLAEIKEFYKNDIGNDEEDLNAVAQHYEEKRKEKIAIVAQVL